MAFLFLILEHCQAQTMVGGTISSNATWYPSGNPYIVTETITINENVTLTVKPGVIVRFEDGGFPRSIIVNGTLRAIGTEDSMITFTSNAFILGTGVWGAFIFNESAQDYDFSNQTGCILQYCSMEYGGSYFFNIWGNVLIVMNVTATYVDHCIISKAANNEAIYALGCASEIKITNNKFISMGGECP